MKNILIYLSENNINFRSANNEKAQLIIVSKLTTKQLTDVLKLAEAEKMECSIVGGLVISKTIEVVIPAKK